MMQQGICPLLVTICHLVILLSQRSCIYFNLLASILVMKADFQITPLYKGSQGRFLEVLNLSQASQEKIDAFLIYLLSAIALK